VRLSTGHGPTSWCAIPRGRAFRQARFPSSATGLATGGWTEASPAHVPARSLNLLILVFSLSTGFASTATASPLTPSYTVADLGSANLTLSTAGGSSFPILGGPAGKLGGGNTGLSGYANGSPTVSVSNGQVTYPFALSTAPIVIPGQGALGSFPALIPLQSLESGSSIVWAMTNGTGLVAAVENAMVGPTYVHYVYAAQQNPDGSWGQPVKIFTGQSGLVDAPTVADVGIAGVSKTNQILLGTTNGLYHSYVYDVKSQNLTQLDALPSVSGTYIGLQPIAIDDQGRILAWASTFGSTGGLHETMILLTPAGVSSEPIPAAVPEPTALSLIVLAVLGLGLRRMRPKKGISPINAHRLCSESRLKRG
jgi:hypothetical protein